MLLAKIVACKSILLQVSGKLNVFCSSVSVLNNILTHYRHRVVGSCIVTERLMDNSFSLVSLVDNLCSPAAHRCKTESLLQPSKWCLWLCITGLSQSSISFCGVLFGCTT